ncbi:peptidyl-prolyl cis-trans isomerase E isoform X2 [Prionailurus iriomotensis]
MAADKTVLFVAELAWVSLVALPPQPVSSARDLTALLVLALPRALSLYDLGLGELVNLVEIDLIPRLLVPSVFKPAVARVLSSDSKIMPAQIFLLVLKEKKCVVAQGHFMMWSGDDWLKKFSGQTLEENKEEGGSDGAFQSGNPGVGDPAAKKASSNPQVYMDIKIGNKPAGCIQMLLRSDIVPITADIAVAGTSSTILNRSGLLSMVSSGPNTNSSRFVLTCDKTDWVDGKHIVFGEVTEGLDVLQQIEMGAHLGPGTQGSKDRKPKQKVITANCGEYV